MELDFWAATDNGKTRTHNEDNFLVDKKLRLFVVADGMGGHASGEIASSMCVHRVRDALVANQDILAGFDQGASDIQRSDVLHILEHAVEEACSTIYARGQAEPEKRGMGTTCTLLLLLADRGFIAHVGDSRLYLLRQGQVHQLSDDHSLINELIKRGSLKAEEIEDSPYRDFKNAVTRAVGVYESVAVDTLDFEVLPGDQFMLCSDGLHHYLDDKTIIEVFNEEQTKAIPQAFIDLANAGGGHDNITSVVVRVPGTQDEDFRSKDLTLRISILQGMPIFRYLSYRELVRVMNSTEIVTLKDGETIFHEGSDGEEMYIILEGRVRIYNQNALIATLRQGDHFGEMALVDSAPRSASAIAEGPTRLFLLRRREFYGLIREETKLSVRLLWSFLQVLTERLRRTTAKLSQAHTLPTLPDLTDEVRSEEDPG